MKLRFPEMMSSSSTICMFGQITSHAVHYHSRWHLFTINIWAGIINDMLIATYAWKSRPGFERHFLEDMLPTLLADVPQATRLRLSMWLQLDEDPAHSRMNVHQFLDLIHPRHWISRLAVLWLARSTDLNPWICKSGNILNVWCTRLPLHRL